MFNFLNANKFWMQKEHEYYYFMYAFKVLIFCPCKLELYEKVNILLILRGSLNFSLPAAKNGSTLVITILHSSISPIFCNFQQFLQ